MDLNLIDILLISMYQNRNDETFNLCHYIASYLDEPSREIKLALNQIVDDGLANFHEGKQFLHADYEFSKRQLRGRLKDSGSIRAQNVLSGLTPNAKITAILRYLCEQAERPKTSFFTAAELHRKVFKGLIRQQECDGLCHQVIAAGDVIDATTKDGIDVGYKPATAAALYSGKYSTSLAMKPIPTPHVVDIVQLDRPDAGQSVPVQFLPIGNESDFEDFICDLFNAEYPDSGFQKFGKRGNYQKGIDVISTHRKEAIQCKKKEISRKNLASELKRDIECDVEHAIKLNIPISRLIFVSTFDDSADLIEHTHVVAERLKAKFSGTYYGWQTLSGMLRRHPDLIVRYYASFCGVDPTTQKKNKFIPQTYLNNMPRIAFKAYHKAKAYWDTGVTAEMLEGNNVWSSELSKMLGQLAETVYTISYFEGKSPSDYYESKISALMEAAYDSQPPRPGTMHIVIASGQRAQIISEYIVQIVKEATDHSEFSSWYSTWQNAMQGEGDEASWGW